MPTSSTTLSVPMFNFPEELPRPVYKEELLNILSIYGRSAGSKSKFGKPSRERNCKCIAASFAEDPGHKHIVCRDWPRAEDGKQMLPEATFPGKSTPNGFLWGETVLDFFLVNRLPGAFGLGTFSTSSKLLAFMEANDELSAAPEEIIWAKSEKSPRIVHPYQIVNSLEAQEKNIAKGFSGTPLPQPDESQNQNERASPWPTTPFSYQPPILQKKLPLHCLPKEIIVHDPWNLLAVSYQDMSDDDDDDDDVYETWGSRLDITHRYCLQLTPAGEARLQEELASEKNADFMTPEDEPDDTLTVKISGKESFGLQFDDIDRSRATLIRPPEGIEGFVPPAPYAYHPLEPVDPPKMGEDPEAHLYLSPSHPIGKGHHSMVYNAEWELPRNTLVHEKPPHWVLCEKCVEEDAKQQIIEMDGEDGERMEEKWKELTGYFVKLDDDEKPIHMTFKRPNSDGFHSFYKVVADPGRNRNHYAYIGPVRPLRSRVKWQDSHNPSCIHLKPGPTPPSLARVRVVAKLSMNQDRHLAREANNYQRFEPHMSEHWNGYNLVPPSFDPVPVGAIIPQFYGYYVPVRDEGMKESGTEGVNLEDRCANDSAQNAYLSPIMLLENCGIPVDPADLTKDERNEASSLFRRFHHVGWSHGSIYPRNVLVQYGPLDLPPWERKYDKNHRELSFRIIDFGRSEYDEKNKGCRFMPGEHRRVEELFKVGVMEWGSK